MALIFHKGNIYTKIDKKIVTGAEVKSLHEILSVKVPGHYYSKKFRRGQWDGYKHFFNRLTGSFYSGLLGYITQKLNCEYQIVDDRIPVLSHNNPLHLNGIELRDYQIKMIDDAIANGRGIISAPPNSGKCLHGNTLISLANGTIKLIKDLRKGDVLFSLNERLQQVTDVIKEIYSNGFKPLFKITTANGREIIGTENHPILSGLEFKCIKNLRIGDLIGTVRKYDVRKEDCESIEDFKIIFLAYHLSEGSYSNSVTFCNTNRFMLDEYKKSVECFSDTECVEDHPKGTVKNLRLRRFCRNHSSYLHLHSRCDAQRFLDGLGLAGKNSHTKSIPEIIFRLNNEKLALFLNRYFCGDGGYHFSSPKRHPYVSFCSASKGMAEQLSHLLLRFGVFGNLRLKLVRGKHTHKLFLNWIWTSSNLKSTKNFVNKIGIFIHKHKEAEIISFKDNEGKSNWDCIPAKIKNFRFDDHKRNSRVSRHKFITLFNYFNKLSPLTSEYIYWDKIRKIETLHPEETFNLTTEHYHNFVANEIYTHNTEVSCGIVQILGLPTVFLTHRITLLNQTKERFEKRLGVEVGIFGAKQRSFKDINIMSIVSVYKALENEDKEVEEILKKALVVIVDECHHLAAKTFEKSMRICTNAYWRYGLSATALLRSEVDNMLVRGLTGDEITGITNQELTECGVSAKATVYLFDMKRFGSPVLPKRHTFDVAYDIGIVGNPQRNTLIVDTARHFLDLGKSVFIIVHRIEHGRILSEIFHRIGLEVPFISGEEDPNIIKSRLKEFENKTLKCLISSSISDEGLDIPAVDILILGVGNKSALKTIQRVGRGLRKKDVGENVVSIIDFLDRCSAYLFRHSVARSKVYLDMDLKIHEVMDKNWNEVTER